MTVPVSNLTVCWTFTCGPSCIPCFKEAWSPSSAQPARSSWIKCTVFTVFCDTSSRSFLQANTFNQSDVVRQDRACLRAPSETETSTRVPHHRVAHFIHRAAAASGTAQRQSANRRRCIGSSSVEQRRGASQKAHRQGRCRESARRSRRNSVAIAGGRAAVST